VFDWPSGGKINLPGLQVSSAYLLSDPAQTSLPIISEDSIVVIEGPLEVPDAVDTVVVLTLQGQ
jgi:hypothetical protein